MGIWYRTGTVSVANGATAVTGTTTGFTSQAKAGDGITFDGGGKWYEIASVTSNTALVLATAFAETSVTDGAYAIDRRSPKWTLASDLALQVADLLDQYPTPAGSGDAHKTMRVNAAGDGLELVDDAMPSAVMSAAAGLVARLRAGQNDCGILIVGDSTGYDTVTSGGSAAYDPAHAWPRLLATALAAEYPTHRVVHKSWDVVSNTAYEADVVVQAGGVGAKVLSVWDVSIPGSSDTYCMAQRWADAIGVALPQLTIINHGQNYDNATEFGHRTRILIAELRRTHPQSPVMLMAQSWGTNGPDLKKAIRAQQYDIAAELGCDLWDWGQVVETNGGNSSTAMLGDGTHLTLAAQQIVADALYLDRFTWGDDALSAVSAQPSALARSLKNYLSDADFQLGLASAGTNNRWLASVGSPALTQVNTAFETLKSGVGQSAEFNGSGSAAHELSQTIYPIPPELKGQWVTFAVRMRRPSANAVINRNAVRLTDDDGGDVATASNTYAGDLVDGWFWRQVSMRVGADATYILCRINVGFTGSATAAKLQIDRAALTLGLNPCDPAMTAVSAAAAQASGDVRFFDTKAAADAALAGLAEDQVVCVFTDETRGNAQTWYRKSSGVYAYKLSGGDLFGATRVVVDQSAAASSGNPAGYSFRSGPARPLGPPPSAPTAAINGAGILNGAYEYAYVEMDGSGYTPLSPAVAVVASSNRVRVTIPLPRRGVSNRLLYRKNPGTSTFRLVWSSDSGVGYFQTTWDDNVADATVAAAAAAPTTDTTALYNLEVHEGVKTFRTHPDRGSGAADLTVITGYADSSGGAYAIDAYGPVVARAVTGNCLQGFATGVVADVLSGYYGGTHSDGNEFVRTFRLSGKGALNMFPIMGDQGVQTGENSSPLTMNATFSSVQTQQQFAALFALTGAGSGPYDITGWAINLAAGYTGSGSTRCLGLVNGTTGSSADCYGGDMQAVGTGAKSTIGVSGRGYGGTRAIGVYGSCGSGLPTSLEETVKAGGVFSDGGNGTNSIVRGYYGTTLAMDIKAGSNWFLGQMWVDDGKGYWIGPNQQFWYGMSKSAAGSAADLVLSAYGAAMTLKANHTVRLHGYGAGTLTTDASGNVTASSDERMKDIAGPYLRGLLDLLGIEPIRYTWRQETGLDGDTEYAGLSAQNVARHIPEAIGATPEDGMLTVSDRPLIAALINAVKELSSRVVALERVVARQG